MKPLKALTQPRAIAHAAVRAASVVAATAVIANVKLAWKARTTTLKPLKLKLLLIRA